MHTIEIDFDVFKALTALRDTEETTYNDVLRVVLDLPARTLEDVAKEAAGKSIRTVLPAAEEPPRHAASDWTSKSVRFPSGTEFRARHKGGTVFGKVSGGSLFVNGKSYNSPSAAAVAVTGNSVNGWVFWECKLPGESAWRLLKSMRRDT